MAVQYIRENAGRPMSVPQVAKALGMSRSSLDLQFGRVMGHTPREQITLIHLEQRGSCFWRQNGRDRARGGRSGVWIVATILSDFHPATGDDADAVSATISDYVIGKFK